MATAHNHETTCHVCIVRRVDGPETDALQAAVAAWLRAYDEGGGVSAPFDYQPAAAELLALIARTAREYRPPTADF